MIMRKEKLKLLSLIMALGLLAAGCGASSSKTADTAATEEIEYDAAVNSYATEDVYSMESAGTTAAMEEGVSYEGKTTESEEVEVQDTQRKLIRNVNLEVETETFEELLSTVEDKTQRLGGYIEESYTYNGSNYYGRGTRNANLTIRIPAENLNEFLSAVSEVSNVISRNESVTDVTLQYVDMDSHKKALQAEQDRLLELLEQAETIEDIISLESRLSEVRYQIESMESQLRTIDNQVSYSTVYLYINEVTKLTPVKEQSTWEKISTGFAGSLNNVGNGIVNFGIGFIIALPYLAVWAVIIVILVFILRLIIKSRKRKKQKALQLREAMEQQPAAGEQVQGQQQQNIKDGIDNNQQNIQQ